MRPIRSVSRSRTAFGRWPSGSSVALVRLIRFGAEAALAAKYGRQILVWMDSTAFEVAVGILIVAAVAGTIISAVAAFRGADLRRTR